MSLINFSNNKLRWFWFDTLVSQVGVVVLLLLLSIRLVWDFINRTIEDVIGLNEYSFLAIYIILTVFVLSTIGYLFYLGFSQKKRNVLKGLNMNNLGIHPGDSRQNLQIGTL